MKIIYEDIDWQFQSLVLPPQKRTLSFKNEIKLVEIPKSIVLVYYDKREEYITHGHVLDFELNHRLNFGNQVCSSGQIFANIYDYISWYWNSRFACYNFWHSRIQIEYFRKHSQFRFYYLAKMYQPNKLQIWKTLDQEHIRNCEICKESIKEL